MKNATQQEPSNPIRRLVAGALVLVRVRRATPDETDATAARLRDQQARRSMLEAQLDLIQQSRSAEGGAGAAAEGAEKNFPLDKQDLSIRQLRSKDQPTD